MWLFREALASAGLIEKLFATFNCHLEAKGYIARGGQIVDATIVSAPKQRNSRDENEAIKSGETPEGWERKPATNTQKDKDARWTKKHGRSYYGYKNHVGIDAKHKFVRRFAATDASVHDSQKLDDMLDRSNTSSDVWADSAYRSAEIEAKLKAEGYKSRIHRRGHRNHPLSERETAANTTRSRGTRPRRACVRPSGKLDGPQARGRWPACTTGTWAKFSERRQSRVLCKDSLTIAGSNSFE